jgi:dTDP-4-dehydrorhamnose reductase
VVVTGAAGVLGRAGVRLCHARGLAVHALARHELDIADRDAGAAALDGGAPWAVVNAAGYLRVDDAEWERERCHRENTLGPALLAELCAERGIALATMSSDLVFDGRKGAPYVESDALSPVNAYGECKAEAERLVLERLPSALVVRSGAFFGPWDHLNYITVALRAIAAGLPAPAADDAVVSPTYLPDLVDATLDLLIDGAGGVWHLANAGALTWADLARQAAAAAGLDASLVDARPTATFGFAAPRPLYTALASERAWILPTVENAICRYLAAHPPLAGAPDHHQSEHDSPPGEHAAAGFLA